MTNSTSTARQPTTRPPKKPPAWFVHTAWRVHRGLYRLTGGRLLWTTTNKRGWGALLLTTTGRTITMEGVDFYRVAGNRISEVRSLWDAAAVYRQFGLLADHL